MPPALILFPSALQTVPDKARFAPIWLEALTNVQGLIVENARTSRRFLKALDPTFPIDNYQWIAQEADGSYDLNTIRALWKEGKSWGLLSDAGYPAVGDPGAEVVAMAHREGVVVRALPGSCSFLLALAASGLGGQNFAFRGYVPVEADARKQKLRLWEQESQKLGQTQIVMDTPYRNAALWAALLQELQPSTRLCLAMDLEGPTEEIRMQTVANWRKTSARAWPKVPSVFLFAG
jgi:16S rRNA (cytidine1402-2'-O)-methyltransferase